jgi:hypothetical protein
MNQKTKRFWILILIFFSVSLYAQQSEKFLEKYKALTGSAKPGKQILVLIAIDKYAYRLPLKSNVDNAEKLKDVLIKEYYFDKVIPLYDLNATKDNIDKLFKKLQFELAKDDSVLIYYSGHGFIDKNTAKGYWIPSDAGLNEEAKENWIESDGIKNYLQWLPSDHVFLISDSCFSSGLIDAVKAVRSEKPALDVLKNGFKSKSRKILISGVSETGFASTDFAEQVRNAFKNIREPFIDPLMIYNAVGSHYTESAPVFGDLKGSGFEAGSDFVLFLREQDNPKADKLAIEDNSFVVKQKKETTKDVTGDLVSLKTFTETEVKKKYFQILFSPKKLNTAAVVLLPIGSTLALLGLSVFIYDLAYFMPYTISLMNGSSYSNYSTAYTTNIGFFSNGIIWTIVGLSMMAVSLSLRLYAVKQQKLSMEINVSKDISIAFAYKFNKSIFKDK